MQVRLLGPVDVLLDSGPRAVHGLRRKAVLAALALHGGEVVSAARLVEIVWEAAAPPSAVNTLQSHVSHLRGVLGSKTAIRPRAPGYLLDVDADAIDVRVAERLLREAAQAAEPGRAARQLSGALALWRGEPLADVTGLAWLEEQAGRLQLLRVRVERALFEARLAGGEHATLVPGLERMVAGHPLDERVHALLMLALYRGGRQADALAAYRRLRETLGRELGIDPSQALRDLEVAILQQDPALAVSAAVTSAEPPRAVPTVAVTVPGMPAPAQLPPAQAAFAGRAAELASLDGLLATAQRRQPGPAGQAGPAGAGAPAEASAPTAAGVAPPVPGGAGAVVISAVSGTAGVGKTALAVTWAHRVAAHFPEGQLYVNLRGFDPSGRPLEPGEALRGFLDAFGVPVTRIPAGLAEQAALYRTLLAGKRVLVVLDNARDAEQARPLLPGSPGCLAIVTSRNQLSGLVAAEGAYPLSLDLLSAGDARELLARRLGTDRVDSEPQAAAAIVERCARLPLALTIAAARAATSPHFSLTAIAAELQQATLALDPFGGGGDRATDARAVFSWSYHALTPPAARMFRLLGLSPGPVTGTAAAASIAAIPPGQAGGQLAELSRTHLLTELTPGRYTFHDLLRAYAGELAHAHDTPAERQQAAHRLLDHYVQTAHTALRLIEPYLHTLAPPEPRPGCTAAGLSTPQQALDWFAAEHATLLGAVHLAAGAGFGTYAWHLAWALTTFQLRRGLWEEQASACGTALAAARRAGDITGEAHALHCLAMGYARSGRFGEAAPLLRHALSLFETTGDHFSQGAIHSQLTWLAERGQRPADMLSHSLRALELYQASSHPSAQAIARGMAPNDIGYCHALLGNYKKAIAYCERALAANQELGERNWEAATWHSLGYSYHQIGDHGQAVTCYQRSTALSRQIEDRFNEADTLSGLGDAHHSAGDEAAARQAWADALRIFDELGHPDGDLVRAKLHPRVSRISRFPASRTAAPQDAPAARSRACPG